MRSEESRWFDEPIDLNFESVFGNGILENGPSAIGQSQMLELELGDGVRRGATIHEDHSKTSACVRAHTEGGVSRGHRMFPG
jgi:hypothetical protein